MQIELERLYENFLDQEEKIKNVINEFRILRWELCEVKKNKYIDKKGNPQIFMSPELFEEIVKTIPNRLNELELSFNKLSKQLSKWEKALETRCP